MVGAGGVDLRGMRCRVWSVCGQVTCGQQSGAASWGKGPPRRHRQGAGARRSQPSHPPRPAPPYPLKGGMESPPPPLPSHPPTHSPTCRMSLPPGAQSAATSALAARPQTARSAALCHWPPPAPALLPGRPAAAAAGPGWAPRCARRRPRPCGGRRRRPRHASARPATEAAAKTWGRGRPAAAGTGRQMWATLGLGASR